MDDMTAAVSLRDDVVSLAGQLVADYTAGRELDAHDVARLRVAVGDLAQLLEADVHRKTAPAHILIADHNGEPACNCGYDPAMLAPPYRAASRQQALSMVQRHVRMRANPNL